jgi:hypothetical protein
MLPALLLATRLQMSVSSENVRVDNRKNEAGHAVSLDVDVTTSEKIEALSEA